MAESAASPLCPHCGRSLATAPPGDVGALVFASEASQTMETEVPVTHCGDDSARREEGSDGFVLSNPRNGNGHGSGWVGKPAGESAAPAAHPLFPDSDEFQSHPGAGLPASDPLFDVFAEATAPGPSGSGSTPIPSPTTDEHDASGPSWPLVLLGSYASAMTLAVAWLLWHGYGREATARDTLPAPSRAEIGRQPPPPPLPDERRASLGKTLRVGSLEVTPLALRRQPVRLEWSQADGERGEEVGPECLVLRLRIKNVAGDETFAPMERAAILRPDSGAGESFLQVDSGAIEPFPLAVASEKRIVGQSFAELKPGEVVETILVSEADGPERFVTPGTWRVKLRVTPDQLATIGVDLRPDEVQ